MKIHPIYILSLTDKTPKSPFSLDLTFHHFLHDELQVAQ